jgi:transposase
LFTLKTILLLGSIVRFEMEPVCKSRDPLYTFGATLGFSRGSFVVFVTNMKTVVVECNIDGEGAHRFHAGFLDSAKHCGFVITLCRPLGQTYE